MTEEKTLEELVSESLNNSREEIIKNGIDGVKKAVEEQVKWKIGYVIENEISEMFNDEEVKEKLSEEMGKVKLLLVSSFASEMQKILPKIASEIAKNIQKKALKNLTEDSYSMRDFYKKLFD